MSQGSRSKIHPIWLITAVVTGGLAVVGIAVAIYRFIRRPKRRASVSSPRPIASLPVQGLTEAEAAARHTGVDLDALMAAEQKRFTRAAIRHNLFTWVNINLFTIAIIMLLLESPLSTLGTLFVLFLNIVLNVLQETMTKKRLDDLVQTLLPKATVIREGKLKSIAVLDVVPGDVLVVGPGDSILVDGEIVGDGEIVVNEAHDEQDELQAIKRAGDRLQTNTFCVGGHALYQAGAASLSEDVARQYATVEYLPTEFTPLQRIIRTVLIALFGLSIVFGAILLVNALITDVELVSDEFRNAVAIIIGAAPTSLFFIVIIHYVVGAFRMAEAGALVYNSQSMETVASISTLCLSQRTLLQGMQVDLEYLDPPADVEPLANNLVQRMLGDVVHSVPPHSKVGKMMVTALAGETRTLIESASFLPVQGWAAATFDEPDLRGFYVVGEPELLEPYLHQDRVDARAQVDLVVEETQAGVRRWAGKLFRRRRTEEDATDQSPTAEPATYNDEARNTDNRDSDSTGVSAQAKPESKPSLFRRFVDRIRRSDDSEEVSNASDADAEEDPPRTDEMVMLFAYLPDVVPIYDRDGNPQLPADLIPLCTIRASAAMRPEISATLQALIDADIDVKVLSDASPVAIKAAAVAAGVDGDRLHSVTGEELVELDEAAFGEAVEAATVIGQVTPAQKANIVAVLQAQGRHVAMLGNDVSDLPAMRQASLRLALPGSSQAALMQTDIALLEDSLTILPQVMTLGQRVVNGVLDTFKLNLSQVLSQLLLIIAVIIFQVDTFPYLPVQGGIISVFTITLPNILLIFWSSPGRMTENRMRRRLIHFTLPAGITLALLALLVSTASTNSGHTVDYTRLVVTYTLLLAGWARILFVQPPTRFWVGGDILSDDRRVFAAPAIAAALLFVLLFFPRVQEWFKMTWLDPRLDYLLIAIAVGIWVLTLRTVWRLRPLRRYGEVPLPNTERPSS